MTMTGDTTMVAPPGAGDPFEACLSLITQSLGSVVDTPAWSVAEPALLARLEEALRARAGLEELTARLVASAFDRELPRLAGATSDRAWLMSAYRLSVQEASRLVREAAIERRPDPGCPADASACEVTRLAWSAGELSAEQAVLIGSTIGGLSDGVEPAALDRLQIDLAGYAQTLSFRQLQHVCRHAVEVVDPDGADAKLAEQLALEEKRAEQLCELSLRRSGDGWTKITGRLPDAQADLLRRALESFTAPRHRSAGPLGDAAGPCERDDEQRATSYSQRLGWAFSRLIEHLPVQGLPQHGSLTPTIVITVGLEQLRRHVGEAMLDTGTPISPGQLRRLACNAMLVPAVLGTDSMPLDLGRGARLFDRHQRLALTIRDRGCVWPGCDRPAPWCEAHHVDCWAQGGRTDLANGCLLCPYHHHLLHGDNGWTLRMAPDGIPEITPPRHLDPNQRPLRNDRHTNLRQ